ncbi:hypothetical protein WMY93_019498 [Mugilogobius chulae]|uniref:WD repeat-containing protein 70 n=1 Tax=Mugilogobius chulae TaxID=88201 RepID=A0AAW0NPN1_9GOBI
MNVPLLHTEEEEEVFPEVKGGLRDSKTWMLMKDKVEMETLHLSWDSQGLRSHRVLEEREKEGLTKDEGESSHTVKNPPRVQQSKAAYSRKQSDSSSDSESEIGPPVPRQFQPEEDDDELVGPPLPPGYTGSTAHSDDDDEDNEGEAQDEDNDDPVKKFQTLMKSRCNMAPKRNGTVLYSEAQKVSALGLDPSGARLVSGGYDFDVRFWDFAGMDQTLQAFRTLQPCECHQIKSLQYSITGDVILVISGNSQAKVLDRDGFNVMECIKGDQYIVDMANTKGHTAMLNCGCWHPKTKEEFMTCSNDGTVRTWDVTKEKQHKAVFNHAPSRERSPDSGHQQEAGVGSHEVPLQTSPHSRSDTSCITFSYDGVTLASRGGDDTLKIWDMRNFKKPLNVANGLTNYFSMTDCCFSPDDKLLVTGTSVKKDEGNGKLVFFDRNTFEKFTRSTSPMR